MAASNNDPPGQPLIARTGAQSLLGTEPRVAFDRQAQPAEHRRQFAQTDPADFRRPRPRSQRPNAWSLSSPRSISVSNQATSASGVNSLATRPDWPIPIHCTQSAFGKRAGPISESGRTGMVKTGQGGLRFVCRVEAWFRFDCHRIGFPPVLSHGPSRCSSSRPCSLSMARCGHCYPGVGHPSGCCGSMGRYRLPPLGPWPG